MIIDIYRRLVSSYGPVAIALCADDNFSHYGSGVFYVPNCCTTVNHASKLLNM
jgi:hypothetical protein